ncbi:MAG: substrate-binding domain-containing protein [Burkholderiaceae bacterium]
MKPSVQPVHASHSPADPATCAPVARRRPRRTLLLAAVGGCVGLGLSLSVAQAAEPFIVMASTTSTENSGLFKVLLPAFTAATGIEVRVVAQGTGQAIETARRGDADVLFVHNRKAEDAFVAAGDGLARRDVMYNDFVIVGPSSDPAGVAGGKDVTAALTAIAGSGQPFLSRGDKSGTHAAELRYWKAAGIAPSGAWYRETGSGMGATLNVASGSDGYALTDRGTWLNFSNRGKLRILVEGDPKLFNPYGVIVVNPARHPHVKARQAQAFADWIVSEQGQAAIAGYQINGEPAFFPNAKTQ